MTTSVLRRLLAPWTEHPTRLNTLETRMSASSDAFAELDNQLSALERYVANDDASDAAEVTARANRIRSLLASVNPEDPAPAPGEDGAVEPDPSPEAPVTEPTPGEPTA